MKLATKIHLLAAGMAIAPVLISLLVGLAMRAFTQDSAELSKLIEWQRWFETEVVEPLRAGTVPDLAPPDSGLVVVMNEERRVVASSAPDRLAVGTQLASGDVLHSDAYGLEQDPLLLRVVQTGHGGTEYRVAYSRPELAPLPPSPGLRAAVATGMIALLLLLGGGAGVFIVRDFSRRLGFLQSAIHRIAGGDLSTPVRTRSGDEMAELASELEAMRSALLEGRNQGMRMLMSVSHDLGTPLTTILGYVEALEDDVFPDRESRTRSLQAIRNKAELLQDRIGQLVEFVRIGSGAEEVEWEQVRLAGYLRETAESMRSDAEVSGRRFIWSVEVPEADTISMSRPLMNRLFENLFQNALRYTREHDTMRLRAWAERPQFVVVFEDSGPGFTDMDPEESFELFRRGSHGRNEPGSGMGLATVKSIAQMHGFTVEAGTSELGGAAFTLRGPLHSAA